MLNIQSTNQTKVFDSYKAAYTNVEDLICGRNDWTMKWHKFLILLIFHRRIENRFLSKIIMYTIFA